MLKKITALLITVSFLIVFLSSCGFLEELIPDFLISDKGDSYHEIHTTVTVSVSDGEHYTVVSENPIKVGRGLDASFDIEFEKGYEHLKNSADGDFADGKLTVKKVFYPTTVRVFAAKKQVVIEIPEEEEEDLESLEVVRPTPLPLPPEDETLKPDEDDPDTPPPSDEDLETVVLSAEPKEGYHFIAWTLDMPLTDGGEVFSEAASGKFNIPTESIPIANYVDDGHYAIMYRTSGGTTTDGKAFYYQTFSNETYLMPNTLMYGSFTRQGYALLRYTENADGSGESIPLGGKTEVNENGFAELWLKWTKLTPASDFSFATFVNGSGETALEIKSYKGSADEVAIPDTIKVGTESYKVERICKNAFEGKKIKKLLIPPTVTEIEEKAFLDCTELTELTIHDTVSGVSDKSFENTAALAKIYLNAARPPVLAGSGDSMFLRKYERLRMTYQKQKKVVVMSGSSSLYGFYAELAELEFDGEYAFVNYGTNAGANSLFYMAATLRFFGEGDILIHAPELTSQTQMGSNVISDKNFRACESTYELFSYVDMTQFTGFFDALSSYNQNIRAGQADRNYEMAGTFINAFTDMTTNSDNPDYVSTATSKTNLYTLSRINSTNLARMNAICAALRERGAQMYFTFAPYNLSVCTPETETAEVQNAFVSKLAETIDYTIISKPSDYLFTQEHFKDSDHHLGKSAAIVRTARLVADLKAQLEADKNRSK